MSACNDDHVITWSSLQADKAPTYLMFTDEMQETQAEGGTWSDRFDADNFINQNQFVALVLWWLMIVVFGIVTWPLLFVTFPALADRGYGFAKMTGMVIVAFVTWALATMRIPAWNQTGILVVLLAMTALSVWITWRNRGALAAYIRERWSLLIWIEAIMLVMFLMFVGVRMTNPDLWHYGYGGEKPMDFAYFNGVLRSTVFPPIDPWFAGGYINYYYFGFVIVGVPTLLLGVVPSIAYNLIVPTLFSITGIAAFSLAYSIVNRDETRPDARRMGNPWVAGFMALLLAVVLGNLDTVRVIGNGVAALGGHTPAAGLQTYLIEEYTEEYLIPPDEAEMVRIQARAQDNRLDDRLRYEFDNTTSLIGGLLKGFGNLLRGQELRVSSERWFWGPTRVIAEIPPPDDGAINEMPYFTFLYGDLHAHMIALPMMFFVMAFVYHELVVAGHDKRRVLAVAGAIILGGGMVGLLRATNTWDYPTFTILSVAGLGYAWWLAWRRFSRWSLLRLLARVGGFVLVGFITALPFTLWFSTALTQFKIWEGQKTPIWAYIDIHGLFLFLVVSFMAWETVHWLRSVRVSALRGQFPLVMSILSAGVVFLLAALILALMGYPIGLIVVPLVAWIALLFFRPGQTRQVQYILVLFGLGLAITLGTEFITLTNDNGRQNTIFKFYIQVWLFFSIAGGVALAWLVQQSSGWRLRLRAVWYGVAAVLIFIAALYPLMATRGKAAFRMAPDTPVTLDGMEYMKYTTHWEDGVAGFFSFNDDYRIIRWLQENVEGSPTIMEAVSGLVLYQWGGRISINTGLPSVVGWDYHQQQQRSLNPLPMMVSQRVANVNAFYTTRSIEEAVNILRYYDIEYVIFSSYEQERYLGSDGLEKFPDMIERGLLEVAYEEGRAVIYRVNRAEIEQVWRQQLQ